MTKSKHGRNAERTPAKLLRQSELKFAILLVLLLCIMGIAPTAVIEYVIGTSKAGEPLNIGVLIMAVVSLTAGFLFMAGGLGLWAFRSSMEAERLSIISRFVKAMDYISDGLIILDKQGRVIGANASAALLAESDFSDRPLLVDRFPGITADQQARLLDIQDHTEFEVEVSHSRGRRTFRFRTQFEEGIHLVQISDVTKQLAEQRQHRQHVQLQFIGKVARGVAHDFNNILCAISGHSALMKRSEGITSEDRESLDVIVQEAERGASLARRLLDLGRLQDSLEQTRTISDQVRGMKEILEMAVPRGWTVSLHVEDLDIELPLASAQFEQIVTNLCQLVTDQPGGNQTLFVILSAAVPAEPGRFSLLVYVGQSSLDTSAFSKGLLMDLDRSGGDGVLLSVVSSLVQECGGTLCKLQLDGRDVGFRVDASGSLTGDRSAPPEREGKESPSRLFPDMESFLLFSTDARMIKAAKRILPRLPDGSTTAGELDEFLLDLERNENWGLILVDEESLDGQDHVVIRIIHKLNPQAQLMLLSSTPEEDSEFSRRTDAACVPRSLSLESVFQDIQSRLRTA